MDYIKDLKSTETVWRQQTAELEPFIRGRIEQRIDMFAPFGTQAPIMMAFDMTVLLIKRFGFALNDDEFTAANFRHVISRGEQSTAALMLALWERRSYLEVHDEAVELYKTHENGGLTYPQLRVALVDLYLPRTMGFLPAFVDLDLRDQGGNDSEEMAIASLTAWVSTKARPFPRDRQALKDAHDQGRADSEYRYDLAATVAILQEEHGLTPSFIATLGNEALKEMTASLRAANLPTNRRASVDHVEAFEREADRGERTLASEGSRTMAFDPLIHLLASEQLRDYLAAADASRGRLSPKEQQLFDLEEGFRRQGRQTPQDATLAEIMGVKLSAVRTYRSRYRKKLQNTAKSA